jgi:hypothetical protein
MPKSSYLSRVTRSPIFWVAQVAVFIGCTYSAVQLYPRAFPIVDLKIKMDRLTALRSAFDLACQYHWGPPNFQQTTNFDLDDQTQTFVELSAGGSQAFSRVLKDGLYSPYTWRVRHFAEGKTNETQIRFTPAGQFYGFKEHLGEDVPGKALDVPAARKIAEDTATHTWKVDLSQFQLAENSDETRPSKRVDHTFVYERPNEKIGEGRYRLRLVVSGDQLTELTHFIKIPDGFSRRYAEMRSSNNTIAGIASVAMAVLYLLLGCGLGIFFLAREHWIIWKPPLICALVVSSFQFLEQINNLPLLWMSYSTALSMSGFLLQNIASWIVAFLGDFFLLAISFMAAESLSRKAFPKHPQLWRIWAPGNANSPSILGRTLGGYLSVGFFFAFVVVIYMLGTNSFGWWSPSDTLFHPDGLATYSPWFTSIANSLHAGFWEESLFRAVPLAGAALLGEKLGHRKKFIVLGFLVQALIFAGAHANYPAQPSYARVIELIIPSFMFGGLYLVFGLLPGIILHFTFDVVSFSIPLFTTSTPSIWMDRTLVVFFSLTPLWIILVARLRAGAWVSLKAKEFNQAWKPLRTRFTTKANNRVKKPAELDTVWTGILTFAATACLFAWCFVFNFKNNALPLEIERSEAIAISRSALEKTGVHLSPPWKALAGTTATVDDQDDFIWRTEGADGYRKLMGSYLTPPAWQVRFVRFDTSVEERAEEYQVIVARGGEVLGLQHELPESRQGASLDQAEAKKIGLAAIEKDFGLKPSALKEISSKVAKLPSRKDWLFIFADPGVVLKSGEARIGVKVAGDQAVFSQKFIFVPEEWSRAERNRENFMNLIKVFCGLILGLTVLAGIAYSLLSWTKKKFEIRDFRSFLAIFSALGLAVFINALPNKLAQFSTREPQVNQIINIVAFGSLKLLFLALFSALIVGYFHYSTHKKLFVPKTSSALTGYSLGIILTVLTAGATKLFPPLGPTWGDLLGLDNFLPVLMGLQIVEKYILLTLVYALLGLIAETITDHWSKREPLGCLYLILFGFAVMGAQAESFISWIALGSLFGAGLYVIFRFVIRSNLSLIPLISASSVILLEIKEMRMRPYPGLQLNGAIAIALVLFASFAWYKKLNLQGLHRPK